MTFRHFYFSLCFMLGFFALPVMSQVPQICSFMAYVSDNEQALYIQGGHLAGPNTNQLFSLNLTKQWTDSDPSWKALTPATGSTTPLTVRSHSMTLSRDSQTLTIRHHASSYKIDLKTMIWGYPLPLPGTPTVQNYLSAIMDPISGRVYIPYGSGNRTKMAAYDPDDSVTVLPMPPSSVMLPDIFYYSTAWSTLKGTVLLYGGITWELPTTQGNPFLIEYNPTNEAWSRIATSGASPGDIYDHCMVPAYNGTKMVLFGGRLVADKLRYIPVGSIFILDVNSMSWTKGENIASGLERDGMACTVSGDYFVTWGGSSESNFLPNPAFSKPAIYNLRTGRWTNEFIPTNTSTSVPTSVPKGSSINGAAIGGGIAAAVVVLIAIGFLIHRRRKLKHTHHALSKDYLGDTPSSERDSQDPETMVLQDIRTATLTPKVSPQDSIPTSAFAPPSKSSLNSSSPAQSKYYLASPPFDIHRRKILTKFPHVSDYLDPSINKTKEQAEERHIAAAAKCRNEHHFPPKLTGWDFYRSIGSPKHIVAPMVDQSELAWRILCRRYRADLCYTPMFHARLFATEEGYREEQWVGLKHGLGGGGPNDRPLITQFCANDPELLLRSALMVAPYCDAIDINLGCPQAIAKKGYYGSYLMDDWPLVSSLISTLHKHLPIPVTAKIRVFPEAEKTIAYAKMVVESGAQILVVHGRLKDMKGSRTGFADWEKIRLVQEAVGHVVPVIANGNIMYHEDLARCLEQTGCAGVMSAEGNLYNPGIFTPDHLETWKIAEEYLQICDELDTKMPFVRGHMFKIFQLSLKIHKDLRRDLGMAMSRDKVWAVVHKLKDRLIRDAEAARLSGEFNERRVDEHGYLILPHWVVQPYIRQSTPMMVRRV
ncbi:hypothetical protein BG011_005153 [Mortierella polycephala]|uniref:tRNA-dihydrouridine(16/17) synthase [NAD(P)(+)] n=1 Tax=Mortierella polycephala TaxID=41804 RepID=A0A9P6PXZ7_9FUNG|nr:hypothetical protein BG011_005153 [Mortierella polycephala]